jgi:hypothetical protein
LRRIISQTAALGLQYRALLEIEHQLTYPLEAETIR